MHENNFWIEKLKNINPSLNEFNLGDGDQLYKHHIACNI